MIKVDFYHDTVCGWCYVLSPRLRKISKEFELDIHHKTFVLQRDNSEMVQRFGSMQEAKAEILRHWASCAEADGNHERFNIEGMRQQPFDYPNGWLAALACKAAEQQQGQQGHWLMFDRIQHAHLQEARNIADSRVLEQVATNAGFDLVRFQQDFRSQTVADAVTADRKKAAQIGFKTIPTMVINDRLVISQTLTEQQLRQLFREVEEDMRTSKLAASA